MDNKRLFWMVLASALGAGCTQSTQPQGTSACVGKCDGDSAPLALSCDTIHLGDATLYRLADRSARYAYLPTRVSVSAVSTYLPFVPNELPSPLATTATSPMTYSLRLDVAPEELDALRAQLRAVDPGASLVPIDVQVDPASVRLETVEPTTQGAPTLRSDGAVDVQVLAIGSGQDAGELNFGSPEYLRLLSETLYRKALTQLSAGFSFTCGSDRTKRSGTVETAAQIAYGGEGVVWYDYRKVLLDAYTIGLKADSLPGTFELVGGRPDQSLMNDYVADLHKLVDPIIAWDVSDFANLEAAHAAGVAVQTRTEAYLTAILQASGRDASIAHDALACTGDDASCPWSGDNVIDAIISTTLRSTWSFGDQLSRQGIGPNVYPWK